MTSTLAADPTAAAPAVTAGPGPPRGWRQRLAAVSGPGRIVAVVAVLSAVSAVVVARLVFPHLSVDNDEALYRLQAQALAQGHLFPPAGDPARSYTPWLAVVSHGHYVLKYTPVVAAFLAVSIVLTGGTAAALAVLAGGLVVVTYLLGVETLRDRRAAAAAATLMACSPLVIVQSALLLPYLPCLLLVELAVLGVLRGLRTGRRLPVVLASLAAGLAVTARPFDTVLMLLPFAGWAVVRARRRVWWLLRWVVAGAVLPALGLLAYNALATGHPFRVPFSLLEPKDALGFGPRKLYPSDHLRRFGLEDGWQGVALHLWLLGAGWMCGGVLLALVGAVSVARRRAGGPVMALLGGATLLTVGYLGFWGVWNAASLWGGIRYVGPFYLLPWLLPLALLGGRGLVDLAGRTRAGVGAVAAVLVVVSCLVLVSALRVDLGFSRNDGRLNGLVAAQGGSPLVFVAADPSFLMHPSAVLSNRPGLDGPVLWALARGRDDFRVLADHPGRQPYGLRFLGPYNKRPSSPSVVKFERLRVVTGTDVTLTLRLRVPRGVTAARFVVSYAGVSRSYDVGGGALSTGTISVRVGEAVLAGRTPFRTVRERTPASSLGLALLVTRPGSGERFLDRQRMPAVTDRDGSVRLLAPSAELGVLGRGAPPAITVLG